VKRATWILATHYRPELLREVLRLALAQDPVEGWEVAAVVSGHPDDPGREVCDDLGVTYAPTKKWWPGQRWESARQMADGELLMLTGDDDLPPPYRLADTVKALEAGAEWCVSSVVRFCEVSTLKVAAWHGEARHSGCAFSITAEAMEMAGGFPCHLQQGLDGAVSMRLTEAGYVPYDCRGVGVGTLCLEHSANMWPRAFPDAGQTAQKAPWTIIGQGPLRENASTSPGQIAAVMRLHNSPPPQRIVARPRWADDAVDWLDTHLDSTCNVLEYGSGDSTLWLTQRARAVTSVEHSPLWLAWGWSRYERMGHPGNLTLCMVPDGENEDYIAPQAVTDNGPYNLVAVDGVAAVECARAAIERGTLAKGGALIFNDLRGTLWPFVAPLVKDWPHRQFTDTGDTHLCVRPS
jgi:hypothetical protein